MNSLKLELHNGDIIRCAEAFVDGSDIVYFCDVSGSAMTMNRVAATAVVKIVAA